MDDDKKWTLRHRDGSKVTREKNTVGPVGNGGAQVRFLALQLSGAQRLIRRDMPESGRNGAEKRNHKAARA
jgi:hypothetical protein